jgi:signal transduction histidine kinase
MPAAAALALYPTWAVAVLFGATALRLGRSARHGLVAACAALALWATALVLLSQPAWTSLAERLVPSGMLMAGAFVHAGLEIVGPRRRAPLIAMYGFALAVAGMGALAPRLLYGPGVRGPGPLFWPLALLSAVGTVLVAAWLLLAATRARGRTRARLLAVAAGSMVGALAGGGAIGLYILGIAGVVGVAPLLLASVLLVGYAVLAGEHGRARGLVTQGLVYALLTATFSMVGLCLFYRLLPSLTPGGGALAWMLFVLFFAALPLDAVRLVVVENIGRALFRRPLGTRDLVDEAERSEARADHVERLAEIGTITSAVAHEMRNPLGIIAAQAKLLERAGADAESVAALRGQVERARRFLDDLLRYGRPRPLDVSEVELAAALESAVAGVRAQLGDEPITFAVACSVPAVEADRAAIVDAVTVLVHNAAIAVADRPDGRVRVDAALADDDVVISVADNGAGVPREIEATLFQPFVSGRGRDARHSGTGLGLTIARRIVERHGGKLVHQRPAEGGARFVIRLPRRGARG